MSLRHSVGVDSSSTPGSAGAVGSRWRTGAGVMLVRFVALGGRFVFVVVAVRFLSAEDLGRFGLLAGLALLIPTVTGLEANQVFLRQILQSPSSLAAATRREYSAFALLASVVSGLAGFALLALLGWPFPLALMGSLIVTAEHLGLEVYRNLISEGHPTRSVASVALRTGLWGLALAVGGYAGLLADPWALETVLGAWLVGAVFGIFLARPLWRSFKPERDQFVAWRTTGPLRSILTRSWRWVLFAISWRVVETGGRFLCVLFVSEAAAGRFTFLSIIASLSYVAQRGVVEPIYYPRLVEQSGSENVYRRFAQVNIGVVLGATACSIAGLWVATELSGDGLPDAELLAFGLLCLAFASLSLTQSAHYQLFRAHADRAIMWSAIAGSLTTIFCGIPLSKLWGVQGAAASVLLGSLALTTLRTSLARGLSRSEQTHRIATPALAVEAGHHSEGGRTE